MENIDISWLNVKIIGKITFIKVTSNQAQKLKAHIREISLFQIVNAGYF